jgi:hypothetical protein
VGGFGLMEEVSLETGSFETRDPRSRESVRYKSPSCPLSYSRSKLSTRPLSTVRDYK